MMITPWRKSPKVHHRIHSSSPPVPILSQLNPMPPANLPKIHSDPILPFTPWSSEWSLSFGLSLQNLVHPSMCVTCPDHLIRFHLIYLMISGDEYKLWSSSMRNFLRSPVTTSLSEQWSQTPSVYSLPLAWETKFHTRTKEKLAELWFYTL
jgi:hypothetical protein